MQPTKQYSKAPITEAVIDIRTTRTNVDLQAAESALSAELADYPNKHKVMQASFQLQLGAEGASSATDSTQSGYRFLPADQKQVAQFGVEGFTFSRLNPYSGWHVFQPEARRLWDLHRRVFSPPMVTRVAVRFINRLDLPPNQEGLSAYLTSLPQFSSKIGQSPERFFLQLCLPQESPLSTLILNEALVPGPPDKVSILLDLDLFRENTSITEENVLWELIEQFHVRKNDVFESLITAKTRRLIDD